MTEKHESWIDIAKATSLILVIFIHSIPRDTLSAILTGFVIPSFFILYGIGHDASKQDESFRGYFICRFRSLMVPFIILSTIMIIMYYIVYPGLDFGFTPLDTVFWFVYGNGPPGRVTHLWFLRTMFFAIILFSYVSKHLRGKSSFFRMIIIVLSPALGVLMKTIIGVELVPWGLDSILISLSFIMVGNEIQRAHHVLPWSITPKFDSVMVVSSLIVFVSLSAYNGFVNIGESLYGQSIYIFMITGVLGTYILCVISSYISKHSELISLAATRFGKYGQEIYEVHPLTIEFNVQFLGSLAIWNLLTLYPGALLFFTNFLSAIFFPYIFASRIIRRSRYLQIMFLGRKVSRPLIDIPSPAELQAFAEIDKQHL